MKKKILKSGKTVKEFEAIVARANNLQGVLDVAGCDIDSLCEGCALRRSRVVGLISGECAPSLVEAMLVARFLGVGVFDIWLNWSASSVSRWVKP